MSLARYYKTSNDFNIARPQIHSEFIHRREQNNVHDHPVVWFQKKVDFLPQEKQENTSISMDMKGITLEHAHSSDPRIWGPAFWFTLHNGAARYPIKASPICAERMKGFIIGMPVMIPCEKCQDHATAHIEQNYNKLDEIVSGREKLFNFFVSFHNYVNKRYGKPEMSIEDAYTLYTGGVNVTKLEYSAK